MTLATLLQPPWLLALVAWNFAVLSAAQLTIRLIMAFSVRTTALATLALTLAGLGVAAIYDLVVPNPASLGVRLQTVPIPMVLMAVIGFFIARRILRIRRLRGQVIAGLMVGLLDPHLFTLL